jgi:hypothetical protein
MLLFHGIVAPELPELDCCVHFTAPERSAFARRCGSNRLPKGGRLKLYTQSDQSGQRRMSTRKDDRRRERPQRHSSAATGHRPGDPEMDPAPARFRARERMAPALQRAFGLIAPGLRPKRIHARQKRSRRLSKRSGGSGCSELIRATGYSTPVSRCTTGVALKTEVAGFHLPGWPPGHAWFIGIDPELLDRRARLPSIRVTASNRRLPRMSRRRSNHLF